MSRHPIALGLSLMLLTPVASRAEWLPNGTPVAAITDEQVWPHTCSDGRGGAFTVWSQRGSIIGQHLTSDGAVAPGWPSSGLPIPPLRSYVTHWRVDLVSLVPDGEGGEYVVSVAGAPCGAHCEGEPAQFFIQRLTARGKVAMHWPADGVMIERAPIAQFDFQRADAVSDGRGGVLVAWMHIQQVDAETWESTVHVQAISPDGRVRWGDDGVLVDKGARVHGSVALTPDREGGAFVFWGRSDADGGERVMGQHVEASGRATWSDGGRPISRTRMMVLSGPVAVASSDRGAIVAWSGGSTTPTELRAARISSDGRFAWRGDLRLSAAAGAKTGLRICAGDEGAAIVAWRDADSSAPVGVFAQRVHREGRLGWNRAGVRAGEIKADINGEYSELALAGDGRGGAYLAWAGERPDGRVFAMRLTRDGRRASGWEANGTSISQWPDGVVEHSSRAEGPWITATGRSHAIVTWDAWQHVDGAPTNGFVEQSFAMLLTPGGPAATPSLIPKPRTAEPLREVTAAIPPKFALRGIRPNPAPSSAIVSFALPDPRPASLEMFDVAGRRVWSRSVGDLGPGEHDVRLRDGVWSAPGVYLVRLTQGEGSATARVVIVP